MPLTSNPLLPSTADTIWSAVLLGVGLVGIAALVVAVVAIVSIARRASLLGSVATPLWVLIVLAMPFVGPLVWFIVGRRGVASGVVRPTATPAAEAGR